MLVGVSMGTKRMIAFEDTIDRSSASIRQEESLGTFTVGQLLISQDIFL